MIERIASVDGLHAPRLSTPAIERYNPVIHVNAQGIFMHRVNILLLAAIAASTGCIAPPTPPATSPSTEDMSGAPDLGEDMGSDTDPDMTPPSLPDAGSDCVGGLITGFYRICNASDLEVMRMTPGAIYELGDDITLPDNWVPLPTFSGMLDGNGHTISGFDLVNRVFDPVACDGNEFIAGGFIDRVEGGEIRDIHFQGIVGEPAPGELLPSTFDTGEVKCSILRGGVFGVIEASGDTPIILEDIYLSKLRVRVASDFGALAYRLTNVELKNVHLLGFSDSNRIVTSNGDVGGLVHTLEHSSATMVSAQVSVRGSGPEATLHHVGLLASSSTRSTISGAIARGSILSSGGPPSRAVGGLFGRVILKNNERFTLEDCAVEHAKDEVIIDAGAASAGGLIGHIDAAPVDDTGGNFPPGDLSNLTLQRCRVGQFISGAQTRSAIRAAGFSGGVVGKVTSSTQSALTIGQVYINTHQEGADQPAMVSCHAPRARNHNGEDGPEAIIIGGAPEPVSSEDANLSCNGLMSVEAITPDEWEYDADQMRHEISIIESFFGPLREQDTPPSSM